MVFCPPPNPLPRLHRWRRCERTAGPDKGRSPLRNRGGTSPLPDPGIPGIQGTGSGPVSRNRGGDHEVQPRRDGEEVYRGAGNGCEGEIIDNAIVYNKANIVRKLNHQLNKY